MRCYPLLVPALLALALSACTSVFERQCGPLLSDPRIGPLRGVVVGSSTPSLELKNDPHYVTDEQRAAIPILQQLEDDCQARLWRAAPRLASIRQSQNLDAARIALYNRQITIGAYNQIRATAISNMQLIAAGGRAAPLRAGVVVPPQGPGAPSAPARSQPGGAAKPFGTGSGFVVSEAGHVVTNAHVAETCTEWRVHLPEGDTVTASLVAADHANDLALLKLPAPHPPFVRLHAGRAAREGDAVVAVGFPLRQHLSSGIILTTGTVSAMSGYRNDTRFYQISAPIQPGNSGGPLLDMSGNLLGVTTGSLETVEMVRQIGSLPQNLNFAIKEKVVRDFLETNGVTPSAGAAGAPVLSAADVGERAKQFTMLIECWK
jgi:S1-C subfamily serine protease